MSTNIPSRNKQLAMQAKLSTSDESARELLVDWLLGHEASDAFDPVERAQLVLDIRTLNGLSSMSPKDWHITAAALASGLEETDANCMYKWIGRDIVFEKYGEDLATLRQAIIYWDRVAVANYQLYAACSVEELLDASNRMVCTKDWL